MPIDGRAVNDQLRKALGDQASLAELARNAMRVAVPKSPPNGCGLAVAGQPGGLAGWDIIGNGRFRLWVTDAGGTGTTAGALLALLVKGLIRPLSDLPPAAVLKQVNQALLALRADPPPLVGLAAVTFDPADRRVEVCRGGVPPATVLRASGEVEVWHGPGPFLGAFPADFADAHGLLAPGDRLILATAGPLPVEKLRGLPADGQAYTAAAELATGPGGCACVVVGFP